MADLIEPPPVTPSDAREAVLRLLLSRYPAGTICPSEAARALAREVGLCGAS